MSSSLKHVEWREENGKRTPICPICHKKPVEHVALKPLIVNGEVVALPHQYSVCGGCFASQRGTEE